MYPLHLSVINDSATYSVRKHAARKFSEGYYQHSDYLREIRGMCVDKAREERAAFKTRIPVRDVTAAANLVAEYMREHDREMLRDQYNPAVPVLAFIRRWWDATNGNSYFSVRIQFPQLDVSHRAIVLPMRYGYGTTPEWETINALVDMGLLDEVQPHSPRSYPVDFVDEGYGRKRDLFAK